MADDAKVMVFVGKQDAKKKDKTPYKKDIYSIMKLSTADRIGVPAGLRKSGITDDVTITKGAAAGATYKRAVKGARGIQYTFHYIKKGGDNGNPNDTTESVSVGFPSGTNATTVLKFIAQLTNKPAKFNSPNGKMHHVTAAA